MEIDSQTIYLLQNISRTKSIKFCISDGWKFRKPYSYLFLMIGLWFEFSYTLYTSKDFRCMTPSHF